MKKIDLNIFFYNKKISLKFSIITDKKFKPDLFSHSTVLITKKSLYKDQKNKQSALLIG